MKNEDIHVGDILQVRQWEDMAREFGTDEYGTIQTCYGFHKAAMSLCGKQFRVNGISDGEPGRLYRGVFDGESVLQTHFFSAEELEPLSDEDWEVADDEQIKLLFG